MNADYVICPGCKERWWIGQGKLKSTQKPKEDNDMTDLAPHKTADWPESTRKVKASLTVTKIIHKRGEGEPHSKFIKCEARADIIDHRVVQAVDVYITAGSSTLQQFRISHNQLTAVIECLQQIRADILKELSHD